MTVTDNNGNASTCTAIVTVEDNVAPEAICQDVTVQLDASGNGSTTPALVDNGSNDACGIASMTLDVMDFDCDDISGGGSGDDFALELDGDEYVNLGVNKYNPLFQGKAGVTVEGWIKIDPAASGRLVNFCTLVTKQDTILNMYG